MKKRVPEIDFQTRAAQKQASRDADARAIASGEKTLAQLREENSFLPLQVLGPILWKNIPLAK